MMHLTEQQLTYIERTPQTLTVDQLTALIAEVRHSRKLLQAWYERVHAYVNATPSVHNRLGAVVEMLIAHEDAVAMDAPPAFTGSITELVEHVTINPPDKPTSLGNTWIGETLPDSFISQAIHQRLSTLSPQAKLAIVELIKLYDGK